MGKGDWKRPTDNKKFAEGYDQAFGTKQPWYLDPNRFAGEGVLSGGSPEKDGPPPPSSSDSSPQLELDFGPCEGEP